MKKFYYDYDANTLYSEIALKTIHANHPDLSNVSFDEYLEIMFPFITETDFCNDIPKDFSNLYYEMESEMIYTISDIREYWKEYGVAGESFEDYFRNSLSENNGSLRKIEYIEI